MSKVVLVTGSSNGIGKSIIIKMASIGYDVVINYNSNYESTLDVQNTVEKYNVKSLIVKCDVSNENEVKEMIKKTVEKFGHIDVLVNNAGIAIDSLVEDKKVEDFKKILDVNLIGTFIVSREVVKYGCKSIINIASTNGIDTYYPYSLDYDASKAGVISLTHNLATYYAPNIRVNAVCPGWVNTEMNKELDKNYINEENKKILLGRFGEPNEIASVVAFLASDEASYINNSIIRVDGGEHD